MKIKKEYILRKVAGINVVIPLGKESVSFNGVMTLNDTGAFLWDTLSKNDVSEQELVEMLLSEYEVDDVTAKKDVEEFILNAKSKGVIED